MGDIAWMFAYLKDKNKYLHDLIGVHIFKKLPAYKNKKERIRKAYEYFVLI